MCVFHLGSHQSAKHGLALHVSFPLSLHKTSKQAWTVSSHTLKKNKTLGFLQRVPGPHQPEFKSRVDHTQFLQMSLACNMWGSSHIEQETWVEQGLFRAMKPSHVGLFSRRATFMDLCMWVCEVKLPAWITMGFPIPPNPK